MAPIVPPHSPLKNSAAGVAGPGIAGKSPAATRPATVFQRAAKPEKIVVVSVIKTDGDALAHARLLWGKDGFADAYQGKIGVHCRVGIRSGVTKIVFATGFTWDEAFERAPAGEETYASILKPKV